MFLILIQRKQNLLKASSCIKKPIDTIPLVSNLVLIYCVYDVTHLLKSKFHSNLLSNNGTNITSEYLETCDFIFRARYKFNKWVLHISRNSLNVMSKGTSIVHNDTPHKECYLINAKNIL